MALLAAQHLLCSAKPTWVVYDFRIAGDGKRFETNIYAHSMAALGQRFCVYHAAEEGIPFSVFVLNSERLHLASNRAMQLNLDVADFRQGQLRTPGTETELRIGERIKPAFTLESWEPTPTAKKCLIGLVHAMEHVLKNLRIDVAKRGIGFLARRQLRGLHVESDRCSASLPCIPAFLQGVVVQLTAHFERRSQHVALLAIWIEPILIRSSGFQHIVL